MPNLNDLPLRIFIGYDSKEPVGYHVLVHSILSRASIPVSITPIALGNLKDIYTRERGEKETTEFSISRFIVPYLSDFKGYSVFMDCDMVCLIDVADLLKEIDQQPDKAILVCQHDYVPKDVIKATGKQTAYPRKNWSSFMIMNNTLCTALTPKYVNTATGLELHRFLWANESIGRLPLEYNWLVGEYEHNDNAKILHFTLGLPCFEDYKNSDHAEDWWKEYHKTIHPIKP